ncbi:hypothetical protein Acj133p043 [Acinetobacter phage 133]|uniref:Uncharacterized protein n=1 Tax=Acinetobacter phage 133 TaxID=2919552 RepID=D9I609_9CAUD|nr:hypothetical protein Acj133p043 [Acinetobacter phage 133]ADJ19390.1 hypothetical protein Acj133p043 [Acinetobacter phage 133]
MNVFETQEKAQAEIQILAHHYVWCAVEAITSLTGGAESLPDFIRFSSREIHINVYQTERHEYPAGGTLVRTPVVNIHCSEDQDPWDDCAGDPETWDIIDVPLELFLSGDSDEIRKIYIEKYKLKAEQNAYNNAVNMFIPLFQIEPEMLIKAANAIAKFDNPYLNQDAIFDEIGAIEYANQ